jgi:hypothetical protein
MWVRNSRDSDVWTTWKALLHSGNYTSYSPTLTGGGASGTWGINITGSAGSVANAVTFTNTGGAAAGATYNGSAARTIDFSTVQKPNLMLDF